MDKIAHISGKEKQSVKQHLENVAELTSKFCENYVIPNVEVEQYAFETGLMHDIGKYSEKFQKKIQENADISVDHSTAGARELQKQGMLAASFAVAGHHGGIPNGWDVTNQNLKERVAHRELEPYMDSKKEIEIKAVEDPVFSAFRNSAYQEAFFTRMLYSALVDADFLDTEKFMTCGQTERGDYDSIETLYGRFIEYVEPWRNITNTTTELNQIRTHILEQCLKSGEEERGIYTLTIPTGGGKTVSSLAFALTHAKKNGMDRIIYVIPYMSIIEQNTEVFRNILGEKNVLPHYSNADMELDDEKRNCQLLHKLSIENWDAPVIVTTSVQFFESLYSNKVSKCRKLHNIANSVIIFDEVQMIPLHAFKPCVKAIQELVNTYKATAVLCTATQPALERWMKPLETKEIYRDKKKLFQSMQRVQIRDMGSVEKEDLLDRISEENQVLVIVNTKKRAQEFYQTLPQDSTYHLSTYMRPVDRKNTLATIRERLLSGENCRVISTSLVEAGVDLDFPTVFREIAGLDSIIQASGRCNREGKRLLENSITWVFRLEDKMPDIIEKNVAMTEETIQKYGQYDSLEAVQYYFTSLQKLDDNALDRYHAIDGFEKQIDGVDMPFKKIGQEFHLIDSDTCMLIIPLEKEAVELVDELQRRVDCGENFKEILRKLGAFAINVYQNEYRKMIDDNSIYEIINGIAVLQNMALYTNEMGLNYVENDGATLI